MKHLFIMAFLALTNIVSAQPVSGVVARSYIVTDLDGNVVVEHNARQAFPIASITKLLVAEQLDLLPRNVVPFASTKLTEDQLLRLALVNSSNQAITTLAQVHGAADTVLRVNFMARERGLSSIHVEEPSGLSANNVASAADLAAFVRLIRDNPIAYISTEDGVKVGPRMFPSTNPLLGKPGWNFHVSKTGFISAAGGCIATLVEIGARPLVVVILGSTNTRTRWHDLMRIRTFVSSTDVFWQQEMQQKKYYGRRKLT